MEQPFSTLDHKSNLHPTRGIQHGDYNCGVELMEICNWTCGGNEQIGYRTIDELKNHRLRIFTVIINIYELTQKNHENNWLFEWKENNVQNNAGAWRRLFISSIGTDFDYNGW